MTDERHTWELIVEVAEDLTRRGQTPFEMRTLIREVQRLDPSRDRGSIQPIVQGLTVNAGTGPPSRGGKPLLRVAHGLYALRPEEHEVEGEVAADEPVELQTDEPRLVSGLNTTRLGAALNAVSAEMESLIDDGLEHLLTEDILRFSLIRSLIGLGTPPTAIRTEVRIPNIGAIDLEFGESSKTLVELKFPRDPTNFGAADTMTLGELIKDFYKVAKGDDRGGVIIQMTDERLRRYLGRRTRPEPVWRFNPGTFMTFTPTSVDALPKSAKTPSLVSLAERGELIARCFSANRIHNWLLVAWSVSAVEAPRVDAGEDTTDR